MASPLGHSSPHPPEKGRPSREMRFPAFVSFARIAAGAAGRLAATCALGRASLDKRGRSVRPPPRFLPLHWTSFDMHAYRSHTCGALRLADAGKTVRLSGWVHRKRDHGQLLFVDLRDHYGITQCVIDVSSPLFAAADALRLESVVTVTGRVRARSADTVNPRLDTGEVELSIGEIAVQS